MDGREFCVIGRSLIEVSAGGTMTNRGNVTNGSTPVTISSNGDGGGQLFITSASQAWLFTLATNTLASVGSMADKADMGDMLDGYFISLARSNSTLYASDLLDGSTWDTGTMFAQRSAAPDPWVTMKVLSRYIWLFGEQTSEVWFDAGNQFPFELHPS